MNKKIKTSRVINIEAVAQKAFVSMSTVSRALRNDSRISLVTRKRVQQVARDLNYRPNPLLSALMSRLRTNRGASYQGTIALINTSWDVETTKHWGSFQDFCWGVAHRSNELGYKVEPFNCFDKAYFNVKWQEMLIHRGIQGIIYIYLPLPKEKQAYLRCLDVQGFSSVSLGARIPNHHIHTICNDHYRSMQICLHELKMKGYEKIGFVIDEYVNEVVDYKFLAAYNYWQSEVSKENSVPPLLFKKANARLFKNWFQKYQPDAVVGIDRILLDWLKEMSVRSPEDVGFALLDLDNEQKEIAGIQQNNREVGALAADFLFAQLYRNDLNPPDHVLSTYVEGKWKSGSTTR